ncbi:MAG: PH domain-containing protein [Bacilli bacterium]
MSKKLTDANLKNYPRLVQEPKFLDYLGELLIEGEQTIDSFKSVKEGLVFTNKRVIIIVVSGAFGKKRQFISYPYNRVTTFVLSSSKDLESHAVLDLGYFGTPNLHFEFSGKSEIKTIMKYITEAVIK